MIKPDIYTVFEYDGRDCLQWTIFSHFIGGSSLLDLGSVEMKKKINKIQASLRPHLFLGNSLTKKGMLQEVCEVCLTPGILPKLFTARAEPALLLNLEQAFGKAPLQKYKSIQNYLATVLFLDSSRD